MKFNEFFSGKGKQELSPYCKPSPFNGGRLFVLFYALGSTQEYRRLL